MKVRREGFARAVLRRLEVARLVAAHAALKALDRGGHGRRADAADLERRERMLRDEADDPRALLEDLVGKGRDEDRLHQVSSRSFWPNTLSSSSIRRTLCRRFCT